jgi:hypothetical protein
LPVGVQAADPLILLAISCCMHRWVNEGVQCPVCMLLS